MALAIARLIFEIAVIVFALFAIVAIAGMITAAFAADDCATYWTETFDGGRTLRQHPGALLEYRLRVCPYPSLTKLTLERRYIWEDHSGKSITVKELVPWNDEFIVWLTKDSKEAFDKAVDLRQRAPDWAGD
jgi:hypothetical protein